MKLVSNVCLDWREMGQGKNKNYSLKTKVFSEMNIDNGGHSWNPYSTFISFGKKISCQDENGKGFQDWLQGEKVKVRMYVAERFPLEKQRPEVSLLSKCSHFQKD